MKSHAQIIIESPRGEQTVHVTAAQHNSRITEILRRAHLPLNTRCGGRSCCDGCMVELVAGSLAQVHTGKKVTAAGQSLTLRACEYRMGDEESVELHIPARSLLAYEPLVISSFRINVPHAHDPLLQQLELSLGDALPDDHPAEALCRHIAKTLDLSVPVQPDAQLHRKLLDIKSKTLYASLEYQGKQWQVTDVFAQPRPPLLGAAIDIGTTTVALLLVDLTDGKILSQAADFNKQMNLGDDVVTRITLCTHDKHMLNELQEAVARRTILPLLKEALKNASLPDAKIATITVSANTTMLHLLAGVDPSSMGVSPFTPTFLDHKILPAGPILCSDSPATTPHANFHLLPGAAAYVGADLTAGVVASGLLYDEGPSLLVDIGTNGEIILKHGDRLLGCATAAGPAFEGAGLSSGIRAGNGAISDIHLTTDPFAVHTKVIGGAAHHKPIGMCGSAYIDFLAEGCRTKLLTPTGRFDRDALPAAAKHLIPWHCNDTAFRVASSPGNAPVVISQSDLGHLLPAKAAIAAGILILLKNANLKPEQIRRVYLAGGFGTKMNCGNAIACGLLPGFKTEQIQAVGNTALAGAYLALLDSSVVDELGRIGKRMEIVELNLDPDFENQFIDQLTLPT